MQRWVDGWLMTALVYGGASCAVGLVTADAKAARYAKREVRVEPVRARHAVEAKTRYGEATRRRQLVPSEVFRARAQRKVSRLNGEAIRLLHRLIRITKDSEPEKPDYYFRLAEHFRDKMLELRFRARALDELIVQAKDGE